MRFIILRKADKNTEAGAMPSEELLSAMADYNAELAKAGTMVTGEGLQPSAKGARITFDNGKPIVTDGPFAETKELLAGYTVIDVNSKEEAIEWVKRWPPMDGDGNVELELRQVFELSDFEPGAGIDKHAQLGEQLAKQPSNMAPYLMFNGQCREAFEFYAECLGGHINALITHGETPVADEVPESWHDMIIHACMNVGKWSLMASDAPPDMYEKPQGIYVQIAIDDPARAEKAFNALSEGGTVRMPFEQTFWAYRFGMLVDRFGIPWMINCDNPACTHD